MPHGKKEESFMEAETTGKHSGRPLSEKEYAEWQRAFSEIEEISASLAKKGKKAYNVNNKLTRRK